MDAMMRKWGGGEVLKKAVRGMLPKNRLRDKRLERLKVFEGASHPYGRNLVRFAGRKVKVAGSVIEAMQSLEQMKIEEPPTKVGIAQTAT